MSEKASGQSFRGTVHTVRSSVSKVINLFVDNEQTENPGFEPGDSVIPPTQCPMPECDIDISDPDTGLATIQVQPLPTTGANVDGQELVVCEYCGESWSGLLPSPEQLAEVEQ